MRLNAQQTRQIILDLPGARELRIPEPISLEHIAGTCEEMVANGSGRAYGWFSPDLKPHGVLVGVVMPNLFTGMMNGVEHIWWAEPEWRGKASRELREAFEQDCREAGCTRLTFGFSPLVQGDRMAKMYQRLGYEPYLVAMSKELK